MTSTVLNILYQVLHPKENLGQSMDAILPTRKVKFREAKEFTEATQRADTWLTKALGKARLA